MQQQRPDRLGVPSVERTRTGFEHRRRRAAERGASLVEYALLVALIVLACLIPLRFFGQQVHASLSRSASHVDVQP